MKALIGGLLLAAIVVGCGSDKKGPTDPGGGGSTQFAGTLLGAGASGALIMTIQTTSLAPALQGPRNAPALREHRAPSAILPVAGTISFTTGGPVSFTGTYDSETDSVHFTATDSLGGVYEFHGHVDTGSTLTVTFGSWAGPHGIGGWGAYQGTATNLKAYCGTFAGNYSGSVAFLVREISVSGSPNGRVVGVLWKTNGTAAYAFKGWAVEKDPYDPGSRTLEIDGEAAGVYTVYFAGELARPSGDFTAIGGVDDLVDPSASLFVTMSGTECQ